MWPPATKLDRRAGPFLHAEDSTGQLLQVVRALEQVPSLGETQTSRISPNNVIIKTEPSPDQAAERA